MNHPDQLHLREKALTEAAPDLLRSLCDMTNLSANLMDSVRNTHPIDAATEARLAKARTLIATIPGTY